MSDSTSTSVPLVVESGGRSSSATLVTSRLMIVAITFFVVVVVFVALLDLYARWRWGPRSRRRRRRLAFHEGGDIVTAPRRGLAVDVLKALPVRIYRTSDSEEVVDCAVCLSELVEGEKVRLLPRCRHGFHVECIDMWFHSHSTCPLCRNPVGTGDAPLCRTDEFSSDAPRTRELPTTTDRSLVIEIPTRAVDRFESPASSPLGSSGRVGDMKSPAAATSTPSRLRSLRRMMSREKRVLVASSCSSPNNRGDDLEMGLTGSPVAGGREGGGLRTPHNTGRG